MKSEARTLPSGERSAVKKLRLGVSESGLWLPKEPKSYSCTDAPSDCWGLGRRTSPATDPFRGIHQKHHSTQSKMRFREYFGASASFLPGRSCLVIARWLLSQLVYFVQAEKGKARLLRRLPVQRNRLHWWLLTSFSDLSQPLCPFKGTL